MVDRRKVYLLQFLWYIRGMARKRGKYTKMEKDAIKARVVDAVWRGSTIEDAAAQAEISERQVYNWMKSDDMFRYNMALDKRIINRYITQGIQGGVEYLTDIVLNAEERRKLGPEKTAHILNQLVRIKERVDPNFRTANETTIRDLRPADVLTEEQLKEMDEAGRRDLEIARAQLGEKDV